MNNYKIHMDKKKWESIFKDWRVLLALAFLILAVYIIYPAPWIHGATIRNVKPGSPAYEAGIVGPSPLDLPVSKERIISINGRPVYNAADYYKLTKNLIPNTTIIIKTNKKTYSVFVKPKIIKIPLNKTINKTIVESVFNKTLNKTVNITKIVQVPAYKTIVNGTEDLGLSVYDAPKDNIRLGLDLQGGTRIILKPEKQVPPEVFDQIMSSLEERLNVYGLSDLTIRKATDLAGNQYVIIEVPGSSASDVLSLVEKQGKFVAKIGNETVFTGGKDIKYVCMSADCSGLSQRQPPTMTENGTWVARFSFTIKLSPEAAQRQAKITSGLSVVNVGRESYLSKDLDLYLDGKKVETLKIGADLKGVPTTDIMISGSGYGNTRKEAINNALKNMKKLQTLLRVGSLPVKLDVVSQEKISSSLSKSFLSNSLLIGLGAIIAVVLVLLIFYKRWDLTVPIIITSLVELTITVGLLTFMGWSIDLSAIAGLIASVGSGVDQQVIITDEVLSGETRKAYTWKQKLKNAFAIITGSYLTTLFAMLPLLSMGAGLLRGFALTTIVGETVGVLITRPAYARVAEILLKKD